MLQLIEERRQIKAQQRHASRVAKKTWTVLILFGKMQMFDLLYMIYFDGASCIYIYIYLRSIMQYVPTRRTI